MGTGGGSLLPREKRPEREANHSLLSSAEVKNAWGYTSTPPILYYEQDSLTLQSVFPVQLIYFFLLIHLSTRFLYMIFTPLS